MAMDRNARLVRDDVWQDPSMGNHWRITGLDFAGAYVHIANIMGADTQRIPIKDFVQHFRFIRRGSN